MRAVEWRHREPTHFRIEQILSGRLPGAMQKLVAVDNLHHAVFVGAVTEIDAVALLPSEIMPCNCSGTGPVAPGCWPGKPKSRILTGWDGSLMSYTSVIRPTRQPGTPETR